MRSTKTQLLMTTLLLAGTTAAAAEPVLTLDAAVDIALRQNRRLGVADADVGEATARLDAARSERRPRLDVETTVSRTTDPTLVFSQKLRQEAFTQADFALDRLNEPDAFNNVNGTFSIYQPIYTGGRLSGSVDGARAMHDAALSGRERTRQEVVEQVIAAYTGAILADRELEVTRGARETARENERLVADLYEAGLVVESDLLQARVRETEVQELVVQAESAVQVSRAALNFALGRDQDTPFVLPESLAVPGTPTEPLEALIAAALEQRPDLQSSAARLRSTEKELRAARSGYLPEVGVTGRAAANAEDAGGSYGADWSVFVGARLTPFDGNRTRASVRQASERRARSRMEHDLLEQSIALEVRQAFHSLRAAGERVRHAGAAVGMAEESLRIVGERYGAGLTTLVELLDTETRLTRARTRQVAAQRDAMLAKARLDLSIGRL